MPQRVLVGVCMLFRFASVLSFGARSIVRGIRLRGVFPLRAIDVALHPALAYECCYTPLVMRCLRLSAELARVGGAGGTSGPTACAKRRCICGIRGARTPFAAVAVLADCAGLCVGKVA